MASTLETLLLAQVGWLQQNTMQLISKQVLGGTSASVTFSNIPQTYDNLRVIISAKSDGTTAAGYDPATMRFNGVGSSSYNWNSWFTTQGSSTVNTASLTGQTNMQVAEIWNAHVGTAGRGVAVMDIPNYSDSNNFKIVKSESYAGDGGSVSIQQTYSGAFASAAAVTSITLTMGVGNFVPDSTFCLYGL